MKLGVLVHSSEKLVVNETHFCFNYATLIRSLKRSLNDSPSISNFCRYQFSLSNFFFSTRQKYRCLVYFLSRVLTVAEEKKMFFGSIETFTSITIANEYQELVCTFMGLK